VSLSLSRLSSRLWRLRIVHRLFLLGLFLQLSFLLRNKDSGGEAATRTADDGGRKTDPFGQDPYLPIIMSNLAGASSDRRGSNVKAAVSSGFRGRGLPEQEKRHPSGGVDGPQPPLPPVLPSLRVYPREDSLAVAAPESVAPDFADVGQLPEWLKAYVYLNNMDDDDNDVDNNDSMKQQRGDHEEHRYLEWTTAPNVGGAGDRISGIVRAFYLALCTDRKFYVDWEVPSSLVDYLVPNFIPWNDRRKGGKDSDNRTNRDSRITLLTKTQLERQLRPSHEKSDTARRTLKLPEKGDGAGRNSYMSERKVQLIRHSPSYRIGGRGSNVTRIATINAVNKGRSQYLWDPYTLPADADVRISNNIWFGNEEDKIKGTACFRDYMGRFYAAEDEWEIHNYYRTAFWTLFRWSPLVVDNVRQIRGRLNMTAAAAATPSMNYHYVALHIRTGGRMHGDPVLKGGDKSLWSTYYECGKSFQRGIRDACSVDVSIAVPLYLASDSVETKETFLEWDADGSIRTVKDMEIFHIDRDSKGRLQNAATAELGVWSDIKMLMDSTCLVSSVASRFSRLGSILPSQQPRCVVDVTECTPENVRQALSHLKGQC